MLRACIECKDEYYGDSWGVNPLGMEHPTLEVEIINGEKVYKGFELVCYPCFFGEQDRKWKPEWNKEMEVK